MTSPKNDAEPLSWVDPFNLVVWAMEHAGWGPLDGGECDSVDTVSVAMTSDESSAETLVSDEDNSSQYNDGEEDDGELLEEWANAVKRMKEARWE